MNNSSISLMDKTISPKSNNNLSMLKKIAKKIKSRL